MPLAQQELLDPLVQPELQELKAPQVHRVPLVLVLQERQEPQGLQVLLDQELLDPQVQQVLQVLLVQLVLEVLLDRLDQQELQDRKERQEVLLEPLVQLDQVQLEPLDH